MRYDLKSITCSIDGASQETYERYRVRGNFERVIENIRRINAYKEIFQTPYPVLTWQFVIFGHNEHEITKAREMARSLNMHFSPKLTWDPHFSPIKNIEKVKQDAMLPEATREEFKEKKGTDYVSGICAQLWLQPQVNWDGKMLGCCRNFWGDFGDNVYSHGLLESINGEKMRYARKMLMGEAAPREDIPCTTCDLYTQRQGSQEWMTVNFF